jgi:hypothetical protein
MAEPACAPPWETRSGTRVGVAGLYKDPSAPPTPFLAPRPRSRARHSFSCRTHYRSFGQRADSVHLVEEEEEEEDLFVFNDTIEGPRAPAVKPGRVTQA